MKRKLRPKRAAVPDSAKLNPSTALPLHVAVALIAESIPHKKKNEEQRTRQDRVRKRIAYDIRNGALAKQPDGSFLIGDLARWAQTKWPGLFEKLPASPLLTSANAVEQVRATSSMSAVVLPATLTGCHKAIQAMDAQILLLQQQLSKERELTLQLLPEAERQRERVRKNRASAKKPRGR